MIKNIKRVFQESKSARICAIILLVIIVISMLAPLSPYDPEAMDYTNKLAGSSSQHWFGTDSFGRDYFTRAMYGGRVTLCIAFFSMLISIIVGTVYGTISGYAGKWIDSLMMRIVDVLVSIPSLLIIVMLSAVMTTTIKVIILIIGFFSWMDVARIVRAETLSLKSRDYVLASKGLGASKWHIIMKHIILNAAPQIIVAATISIASAILIESTLSFLGFGVQLPMASWGSMLQDAQKMILTKPMMAVYPGVLIFATVLSLNVLCNAVQRVFDPRQSEE